MINKVKNIFSGKQIVTDYIRYEFARVGVGMVHVILLIVMFSVECYPVAFFNCFSVIFYAVIVEVLIQKKMYLTVLISTYSEIVLHSLFSSIILGWSFGFLLYNISLIYVAYYFSYISPRLSKKILLPSLLGTANLILTLIVQLYVYNSGPLFKDDIQSWSLPISAMNFTISSIMIMLFASLHTIEIRRKAYELENTNKMLNELAHFDALTKLRNRHSMEEILQEIQYNTDEKYCFVMGDIDNFKHFNDTYGHACGDNVLTSVAQIIMKNMEKDCVACRWGGEEILMLINGDLGYSQIIAEKVRYEIEQMDCVHQNQSLHVTMTFGVSEYGCDGTFEKYISIADKRLYKGKQNGKNCVVSND